MYKSNKILLSLLVLVLFSFSCKRIEKCRKTNEYFNVDSAFFYIQKQVSFGPRVPNTSAHDSCAIYLIGKLEQFGARVIEQNATVKRYDGTKLRISNIIGKFYPQKKRRLLLFAHWDTRFYADAEPDSALRSIPIAGANDGASGVAVLLEIARQISIKEPQIGIDIAFFDAEDQGEPIYLGKYDEKAWSLGVQYWAKKINEKKNKPFLGIDLDMVAAKHAMFSQEDNSRYFNNFEVKRLWSLAKTMGYDTLFVNNFSQALLDDHVFVSQDAGIRSILIADNKPNSKNPFFQFWHTHKDIVKNIDKKTLYATGIVLVNYIYCLK